MNAISVDRHRACSRAVVPLALLVALLAISRGVAAAVPGCEARSARAHRVLLAASLANWEPVNDRTVLIWTKHSTRAHLVRLDRPLGGLTSAAVIRLIDGDGDQRISPCGHDSITLGDADGEAGQSGMASRIVSIELLSQKRTAQLDPGAHGPAPAFKRI